MCCDFALVCYHCVSMIYIYFTPLRWVTKALYLLLLWPLCQILDPIVALQSQSLPTPSLSTKEKEKHCFSETVCYNTETDKSVIISNTYKLTTNTEIMLQVCSMTVWDAK